MVLRSCAGNQFLDENRLLHRILVYIHSYVVSVHNFDPHKICGILLCHFSGIITSSFFGL